MRATGEDGGRDDYAAAVAGVLGNDPTAAAGENYHAALGSLEAREAERRRQEEAQRLAEQRRQEEETRRLAEQRQREAKEREARRQQEILRAGREREELYTTIRQIAESFNRSVQSLHGYEADAGASGSSGSPPGTYPDCGRCSATPIAGYRVSLTRRHSIYSPGDGVCFLHEFLAPRV